MPSLHPRPQFLLRTHRADCAADRKAIGLARVGQDSQLLVFGTLSQLASRDLGPPLHSLILCGELHELEEQMLAMFAVPADKCPELAATAAEDSNSDCGDGDEAGDGDGDAEAKE